jgi:hypothetical protein
MFGLSIIEGQRVKAHLAVLYAQETADHLLKAVQISFTTLNRHAGAGQQSSDQKCVYCQATV